MGWYLRKSVRMGPVRWNLSKSGIGMSAGVRGLRVGTGPRGPYVAGGRGGLYFRQSLGRPSVDRKQGRRAAPHAAFSPSAPPMSPQPAPPASTYAPPVEYLPETNVDAFTPASTDTLARFITAQRGHVPLFRWAVGLLTCLNLLILTALWPLALLTIPASAAGAYYVKMWDRRRTHVALHYDLDPTEQASFDRLCGGIQTLASSARLVRVDARQVHGDWKRNAGATTSLYLSPVTVMPPGNLGWLETNVPVWSVRWRQGRLALIFLPDRVLVEQGRLTAAVSYAQMQVTTALSRFVESGIVPPDARILAYTWRYTNKDGSPDRRFNANRKLPVTEAPYIGFQSASGVTLMVQASNREKTTAFVHSIQTFRPLVCAEPHVIA